MTGNSTDSLPFSTRSRGSVYTTTSVQTLAADTDTLHRLLANKSIAAEAIAGAFEEYAWRGLLRGTRVREWCEGMRTLLEDLHVVRDLQVALRSPTLTKLYPFLSLVNVAPLAGTTRAHSFYPPATLLPSQLAFLARDVLVNALLSLVEGRQFVSEEDLSAPVAELVMEYIGTVWRKMISDGLRGSKVAGRVAKSLVELEFEMQCQGSRSALRTLIFPIIRRIRFDLGFVSSLQLVSRLKSHAEQFVSPSFPCDPHSIISAWALRRLNAGASPQRVHDELVFVREKVRDIGVEEDVEGVMTLLGLEKKYSGDQLGERGGSPIEEHPPVSPFDRPLPLTPTQASGKKGFSLFGKKGSRKTMISPKPPTSYRVSAIERGPATPFLGLPAGFNPDRRPSLPVISSSSYPNFSPAAHPSLSSPLKWSSLTSFQSTDSVDSTASHGSQRSSNASQPRNETHDLLSQIMTFSESSDVRLILLDYVVEVRHRLHHQGEGDWFFGNGRDTAASTLDTLEGRLVGKRDVMDLGHVFKEIRAKFGIPAPGSPIRMASRARRRQPRGRSEASHTNSHMRSNSGSQDRAAFVGQAFGSPGGMSESRGVSFDLDSYYHRHIPEEDELDHHLDSVSDTGVDGDTHDRIPVDADTDAETDAGTDVKTEESSSNETVKDGRRQSTGAASLFSLTSALSASATPTPFNARASMFSTYAFSIREAKVEYPHEAVAVGQGRIQGGWEEVLDHAPLPPPPRSQFTTFHASRSESSLLEPAVRSVPTLRHRRDTLQQHQHQLQLGGNVRTAPIPGHLGVPRPPSPADSFHSLLSALNLETHVPIDFHQAFQDPTLSPPLTPRGPAPPVPTTQGALAPQPQAYAQIPALQQSLTIDTEDMTRSRRRQNRQYVLMDQPEAYAGGERERQHDRPLSDLPEEAATPMLEPSTHRQRHISGHSVISNPASISTLDSIDHMISTGASETRRAELPLAQLLALFIDLSGPGGLAGTRAGTRPQDVQRAVEGFVQGEMRYAEELGSGWDGEDQRRVVWLLRQVAALIADPSMQYPIHQQIMYLLRHPAPSARSSLISNASLNTLSTASTSTATKYLATPMTMSRSSSGPVTPATPDAPATPAIGANEDSAEVFLHLSSRGSRESVGTFGPASKGPFEFRPSRFSVLERGK